tara:strand:- start:31099 stop:32436 length:1338 start_codon:yes stop_codon:yes gene_type:complete
MKDYPKIETCSVAVIGLGYVGLPLAVEIAKKQKSFFSDKELNRKVIGFDIDTNRIDQLKKGIDITNEVQKEDLNSNIDIKFTNDFIHLVEADVFIITVPTPIDKVKQPDLKALKSATKTVGLVLKERVSSCKPLIIYESTVFPGATEEVCIPILEANSGLVFNLDFFCGYSPERINPGDKMNRLSSIVKVTSGSNEEAGEWINQFYASIIKAGTHKAKTIKVAEAAKIIENTQRDINIALINELSIICNLMGINIFDVLEAAGTKWNFLPFKPGLVGGHCIGVDPYYLTYKAQQIGYEPKVILAGRQINDGMVNWIVNRVIKILIKKRIQILSSRILVLGLSFKENCPDCRNSKVIELIQELKSYGIIIDIFDPCVNKEEVKNKYGISLKDSLPSDLKYNAIILAVAHQEFKKINFQILNDILLDNGVIIDLKNFLPKALNPVLI